MRSSAIVLKNILGSSRDSWWGITSDPPATGVGNSVPYDPSKWKGDTQSARVSGRSSSNRAAASTAHRKAS